MELVPQLYPFQEVTVQQIQAAPLNRWIVNYETGLGKTATTIRAALRLGFKNILVFCPAIVRSHWVSEFDRWAPVHGNLVCLTTGERKSMSKAQRNALRLVHEADICIGSYGLAKHVPKDRKWDLIVLDELHRLKNPGAQQTKLIKDICRANPNAAILGLTATLMPNDIVDVWQPLDLIWPDRFGASKSSKYISWKFANRYANKHVNDYGTKFEGLNAAYAKELNYRLCQVSSRVTKQEVANLLPAFTVSLQKLESKVEFKNVDEWIAGQADEKLDAVVEWVEDRFAEGVSKVCVLTHLKETANKLRQSIQRRLEIPAHLIDGDLAPEKRNALLATVRASEIPEAIVATVHSIGIGIDLTFCTQAVFAELYWRPETIIQALGRFSRLSGKVPSNVVIMCLAGTIDEHMADSLMQKISAINQAVKAGHGEEHLQTAIAGAQESDAEILARLNISLTSGSLSDTNYL